MVSLACDAWKVSNCNAYLTVTGHWIEVDLSNYQLCSAVLCFTEINKVHNGMNLRWVLYKIAKHYHIEKRFVAFSCLVFAFLIVATGWLGHYQQCEQQYHDVIYL